MQKTGIVAGTVFLDEQLFADMEKRVIETEFGTATVLLTDIVAYIPRHGTDPSNYTLPHRINHPANITALKALGVKEIIGINSTGSLKKELQPGSLIIPDDFVAFTQMPTIFQHIAGHVPPLLDSNIRSRLEQAARACGIGVTASGTYWQTPGPRFETKAEIRMMAQFSDIVGMTMASETIISCELEVPYAAICSVDNYAHGIGMEPLSADAVSKGARNNARTIARIMEAYAGLTG